jgi:hypothetical protein
MSMLRWSAARLALPVLACAGLTAFGVVRWDTAVPAPATAGVALTTMPRVHTQPSDEELANAEATIVDNDPFRLSNSPSAVRFAPDEVSAPAGAAPPPPIRPVLILKAIVGGPPWQAIVDGLPGRTAGTLVRAGDAFDKLTTRAVTRDSVIIQGPDTMWVLSFRKKSQ